MTHSITYTNKLLQGLPDDDRTLLSGLLEPVVLYKGTQLAWANQPITHVYFLESGVASIVAKSPEGHETEAGMFGREGFGPTAPALGVDRHPLDTFIQVPGEGYRLSAAALNDCLLASPALSRSLLAFSHVMAVQAMYTGLSNAVHQVDERLGRWLLMCHDRVDGDELALTHEYLSLMLSVRRPSVTTALHILEGNRFIRAQRGQITIRDRAKLEEFAVDTYGAPEAEYRRLLGAMR